MSISGIWTWEDLRKGEWSKLELQKSQLFLPESAPSPFKCRLFPKSMFEECGGPGREGRELTIESFLLNAVCTQRLLEGFRVNCMIVPWLENTGACNYAVLYLFTGEFFSLFFSPQDILYVQVVCFGCTSFLMLFIIQFWNHDIYQNSIAYKSHLFAFVQLK